MIHITTVVGVVLILAGLISVGAGVIEFLGASMSDDSGLAARAARSALFKFGLAIVMWVGAFFVFRSH